MENLERRIDELAGLIKQYSGKKDSKTRKKAMKMAKEIEKDTPFNKLPYKSRFTQRLGFSKEVKIESTFMTITESCLYLSGYGVDISGMNRIAKKYTAIAPPIAYSVKNTLKPHVEFLEKEGIKNIKRVAENSPTILTCSIEKIMKPNADYFKSIGVNLGKTAERYPNILVNNPNNARKLIEYFNYIGVKDIGRAFERAPEMTGLSLIMKIKPVIRYFKEELGIKRRGRLIGNGPKLVGYSIKNNLRPKSQYFLGSGITLKQIEEFPNAYSYSFQNRIIPRIEFSKAKGVIIEHLGLILAPIDKYFARKVMKSTLAEYNKFRRELYLKQRSLGIPA